MFGQSPHQHHNYHHHHHLHSSPTRSPVWIFFAPISQPLVAAGLTSAGCRRRRRHFIALTLTITIWIAVTLTAAAATPKPNQDERESERQMHPSLFVDAKVWRGNTEFGERSNWVGGRKPCSLLERVALEANEAVISMGDSMDSIAGHGASGRQLKSDIRELVLPPDGLLLLEDDTLAAGPRDPAFLQMLNDTGDCFDSSTLPDELQLATWFRFEPEPDTQSWFNPSNWDSLMNLVVEDYEALAPRDLVPESHQIPCAEDVVLFGNRRESLFSLEEANTERSRLLSFKVNFRASFNRRAATAANQSRPAAARTNGLRVAKLKIGDKSYTQAEFDQLATLYGNNLFQFRDELSALGANSGDDDDGRPQSVLTIDESSIQATAPDDFAVCLEEAGCECGNEQPAIMDIICSFNEPLESHEMPCRDPIQSVGYCNKICGTSVNINMDPTRFSERYVASLVNKIMTGQVEEAGDRSSQYFSDYIFLGSRRFDHNKYEITIRPMPATDTNVYTEALGREIELAQLIRGHLEKAATKSFYGIKTISIRSTVDWRRDNRDSIFMLTFIALLPLAMTLFAKFDDHLVRIVAPVWQTSHRSANTDRRHLSTVSNETLITSDDNESISGGIDSTNVVAGGAMDNLAMVDLDASSSMGSTLNLLDATGD